MSNSQRPILFFAFANDRTNDDQYLRALSDERRAIEAALLPAERAGLCEVKMLPNATLGEIFAAFQDDRYRDRIALFHYGGHANGAELLLERNDRENDPARKEGLIPLLRNQKGLQMVFLNGCSTEKWALALNEAGIPLVAGTFEAISDAVAQQLAARFYAGIGQGLSLGRAWDEAIANVKASGDGTMRGFGRKDVVLDRFPWDLFQRRGAEIAQEWNLPEVNNNPLAMLPLPEKYAAMPLPNDPFRFLDRYKKEDALIFFGRGRAIRDLYDRLTNPLGSPVVLLSGQSGVGKSSLLEAGLLPRLEEKHTVIYTRRDTNRQLTGTLCLALQEYLGSVVAPDQIQSVWKKIEQQTKRPLVVLLDQVDEAFTRDNGGGAKELAALATLSQEIFGKTSEKPEGKLLLGLRKEYEGEIEDIVKNYKIDYAYVFQKRLNRADIVEVVTGLTSNPRLAQKYGLRVEEGLPETIATDLLTDSDTPVAPLLQIILTKLWQNPGNQRYFTQEEYLKLKEDGIFLGDFFRQQMEKLRTWEKQVGKDAESSGLALDILNSHVTDLGFANSRSLEEIKNAYQHRSDVLELLMTQFKALYLLTDAGKERTALAHDTLAPVVQQEVKNSDRPGQKALRILAGKLANYRRNTDTTYIPEDDLALVERGQAGMRIWMDEEPELIRKSIDRRTAQRRQRRIAVTALLLLAVFAAGFGWQYYQKIIIENWVAQARLEAATDPTIALRTLQKSSQKAPDNPAVLAALNDIWSENEFYEQVYSHPEPVKGVIWAKDSSKTLYSWTENALYRWSDNGVRKDSFSTPNITAVALSPNGRFLVLSTQQGNLTKVDAATLRQEENSRSFDRNYATQLAFSLDGTTLFVGAKDTAILNFQANDLKNSLSRFRTTDEITALTVHPHRPSLLLGYACGRVEERSFNGQTYYQSQLHKDRVLSLAVSPWDSSLTSSGRDALILFHRKNGCDLTLKGHDRRINAIYWSPDSSRLFSAGNDYLVKTWSSEGDLISIYKGHTGFVNDLALSKDGQYFASAGEDKTVRVWKTESKVKVRFGPHESGVSGILLSPDKRTIYTATESGISGIRETFNDPDFDFEDLIALQFGLVPRNIRTWNTADGKQTGKWERHYGGINALASDQSGAVIVSVSDDTTAILWKPDGKLEKILPKVHTGSVLGAAVSPDGQYIVTVGEDSKTVLYKRNGEVVKILKQGDLVRTVAFLPQGELFVTGAYDGSIRLFNLSGNELSQLGQTGGRRIEAICFTPDGKYVLTGEWGNHARLYDLQGRIISTFSIFSENKTGGKAIGAVAVSPNGKQFALAAEGGVVEVFQLQDGKAFSVRHMQHYSKKSILYLSFTPDGKGLLTGSGDGWARWWEIF